MLFWILQISILSIILIMLLHYLFTFFKATLTVPKIKDLVHVPAKKYEDIMNIIDSSRSYSEEQYYLPKKQTTQPNVTTTTSSYEKPDVDNMKNELKSFLKDKLSSNSNTTDISSLDSFSQQQQYSMY